MRLPFCTTLAYSLLLFLGSLLAGTPLFAQVPGKCREYCAPADGWNYRADRGWWKPEWDKPDRPSHDDADRRVSREEQQRYQRRKEASALNEQGSAAAKRGDPLAAIGLYQRATKLAPEDSTGFQYNIHLAEADAAYFRKDWAAQIAALQQALPNAAIYSTQDFRTRLLRIIANAQTSLGMEAWRRQDWKAALDYFREAAKNDPAEPNWAQNVKLAQQKLELAEQQRQVEQMGQTLNAHAQRIGGGTIGSKLDFTDTMTVDLRDAKSQVVDPAALKGSSPAASPTAPADLTKLFNDPHYEQLLWDSMLSQFLGDQSKQSKSAAQLAELERATIDKLKPAILPEIKARNAQLLEKYRQEVQYAYENHVKMRQQVLERARSQSLADMTIELESLRRLGLIEPNDTAEIIARKRTTSPAFREAYDAAFKRVSQREQQNIQAAEEKLYRELAALVTQIMKSERR